MLCVQGYQADPMYNVRCYLIANTYMYTLYYTVRPSNHLVLHQFPFNSKNNIKIFDRTSDIWNSKLSSPSIIDCPASAQLPVDLVDIPVLLLNVKPCLILLQPATTSCDKSYHWLQSNVNLINTCNNHRKCGELNFRFHGQLAEISENLSHFNQFIDWNHHVTCVILYT